MASLRSTELRSKSPDKTKLAHSTPVQIPPLRGALLALSPLTGRKHQLRLHCAAALRAPIIGDSKYSTRRPGLLANYSELKSILKQHLELHAKQTEKGSQFRPVPNLESIFSTLHLHSRAVSLLLPTQLDNPRGETPMKRLTVYAEPPPHMLGFLRCIIWPEMLDRLDLRSRWKVENL